ncbi:MAG: branched-chain amino acid ABC transporter permease [Betaproteobacteria bacterium]|nr:MAG: branched-chain amino acid ABC transporter permease [Betaproteobacteria bacterium]
MSAGAKTGGVALAVAAVALALFPLVAGKFGVDLVTKIMVFAILALSLELLVGQTGLVCFGQAAFFGIGAYTVVLLSPQYEAVSIFWLAPVAVLFATLYALFVGALSLRTRGIYFIMVTLAFAQMAYYVFHDTPLGRGTDGIYLYVKPAVEVAGLTLVDLDKPLTFYYVVLGALALTFAFLAVLLRSRFGRALAGVKANEQRMRAAGYSTYAYKLAAFTLSGAIAGFAGVLFAVKDGFVNPELLAWHLSGSLLVMIILGGLGRLQGAVIGAFAYELLRLIFQHEPLFGAFAKHWQLGLGLTIIAMVALLPEGLAGLPAEIRRRRVGRAPRTADADA